MRLLEDRTGDRAATPATCLHRLRISVLYARVPQCVAHNLFAYNNLRRILLNHPLKKAISFLG